MRIKKKSFVEDRDPYNPVLKFKNNLRYLSVYLRTVN